MNEEAHRPPLPGNQLTAMTVRSVVAAPAVSRSLRIIAVVALLTTTACGGAGGESSSTSEWVSETSTEGQVTTVRTVAGSVWGGDATLREDASIGVESGDDAYMLGSVRGIAEHGGETFVLDQQVPVLRVYDRSGRHLRDLGAEGSGPGEFQRPEAMVIGNDGRIYVRDPRNGRIMILSAAGEELGILRITSGFSTSNPMVITHDGTLYNYQLLNQGSGVTDWKIGMVPQYEDEEMEGTAIEPPDFDYEPPELVAQREGSMSVNSVPFSPQEHWRLAPSGALVAGVADDYSFDIRYPDGRITRVEKSWDPVPVAADEASWSRRSATANMRSTQPDWSWTGPGIPTQKPAFSSLLVDTTGRIWVRRPGPGFHVQEECNENPEPGDPFGTACWDETTSWEVFDSEGRFLGGIDVPEGVGMFPEPYVRDDVFLAVYQDDLGTVMVKRYTIVPPGH